MAGVFRSLKNYNYRLWASGALVSNIGTWMQRTGQDWLVLTQLTDHDATAVGFVMALQFGPQLLLLPLTGMASDLFDRRKLLIVTQTIMGLLALALGIMTLTGVVQLWHVYLFALALGCVTAFDSTARQTFVSALVKKEELSNAVALNSTSFNSARLIGPAVSGLLIAWMGTGWVFVLNALTFVAMLFSLFRLRTSEFIETNNPNAKVTGMLDGIKYVWRRPDIQIIFLMFFLIGAFSMNFPIYLSKMTVSVFNMGAERYGFLTSSMAVGSVIGALLSAKRSYPHFFMLIVGALGFGSSLMLAGIMPSYLSFGITLVVVGAMMQTFSTTANGRVQLSSGPDVKGRVMALYLGVAVGSTLIGAPVMGWVANTLGPRVAMVIGGGVAVFTAGIGIAYLYRSCGLSITLDTKGLHITITRDPLSDSPSPS